MRISSSVHVSSPPCRLRLTPCYKSTAHTARPLLAILVLLLPSADLRNLAAMCAVHASRDIKHVRPSCGSMLVVFEFPRRCFDTDEYGIGLLRERRLHGHVAFATDALRPYSAQPGHAMK